MKTALFCLLATLGPLTSTVAFNNDGMPDLYWRNAATLENAGWWLNVFGTSTIAPTEVPLPSTQADGPWRMVGVGDFDQDGELDIVWHHTTLGFMAYWYMNGTGIKGTTEVRPFIPGPDFEPVGVGYFGGPTDKKPDIVWWNKLTGQVQWFKLGLSPGGLFYSTPVGRIFDTSQNSPYWYYFPSLNVNSAGDMVIGFSGSRKAEHISAFFSGRKNSGAMLARPLVLRLGEPVWPGDIWGDYSATTMDLPNAGSFWTVQQFSAINPVDPVFGDRWGTWVAEIKSQ